MTELAPLTVDDMLAATRQLDELQVAAVILRRHHVSTVAVDVRIDRLTTAPVDVRCYICCRGRVTLNGLARDSRRPVCDRCLSAACDAPYCFVPASVSFSTATGSEAWCAEHGLRAFVPGRVVAARHIVDGTRRRAASDRRLTLAKAS